MIRIPAILSLILAVGGAAQAATTNTTLTVDATGALSIASGTFTANGTVTMPGIGTGSGTISASVTLTSISPSDLTNAVVPFTITLPGASGGTLTGKVNVPLAAFLGGSSSTITFSATVDSGTGSFAGATGSFPSMPGTATGSVSNLTLHFSGAGSITTGGTTGPPTSTPPAITAVLDAASYTKNIAQGSIFVVKGTNMSPAGLTQFSFPLPTTSNGIKITFTPTAGGAGTDAYLVYLFNQGGVNQLAAILPSTLAVGNYNVTVTNNGSASANFAATVVQRKAGIITQDGSGSGLAVVQNFISAAQLDVNRFTTGSVSGVSISPAKPGQVLILWTTGIGPVAGSDNTASPGFDFAANGVDVKVLVGGVSITPLYAGRAPGLAGADQINFTLPASIPTGCTVALQVSVNGQLSNSTFLSIAPNATATACVAPGFTTTQLQGFDQGGSLTFGAFSVSQGTITAPAPVGTIKTGFASGEFLKITGFQLASAASGSQTSTTPAACQVTKVTGTPSTPSTPGTPVALSILDAGTLTLNGPPGSNITNAVINKDATNVYLLSLGTAIPGLPSVANANVIAGQYTLSGAGGKDVGPFNASLNLSPLVLTGGLPSTITRSSGLPLSWTGGNPGDIVIIAGTALQTTISGTTVTVTGASFSCTTTAGQGSFTVPADILTQLPAVTVGATGAGAGSTSLIVSSGFTPTATNGQFTAPLTAGGSVDFGFFLGSTSIGNSPTFQ